MIFFKIRRKSDGEFYPFDRGKRKKEMFYRMASKAVELYNHIGWDGDLQRNLEEFREVERAYPLGGKGSYYERRKCGSRWRYIESEQNLVTVLDHKITYNEIELVKFGPNGEIVVCSGVECTLTTKEIAKLEPGGVAPLTRAERNAGIRDEIGVLLEKIEAAESHLSAGKAYAIDSLLTEMELKETKLKIALEELTSRNSNLRKIIKEFVRG